MTDHDPMCPQDHVVPECAVCDFIRKIRADERGNKRYSENEMDYQTERYHKVGYEQGQRDEREAVNRQVDALDESYAGQTNDWANGWHEALRAMRQRNPNG